MKIRECTKCNREFDSDLIKNKRFKSRCIECQKQYHKNYRDKNCKSNRTKEKEKLAKQSKRRCTKCSKIKDFKDFYPHKTGYLGLRPECIFCFKKYDKILQKKTQYRKKRDKTQKAYNYRKQRRINNIEAYRKYEREWRKKKKDEDPFYKIKMNLSSRVSSIIRNKISRPRTIDLLGCDRETYLKYIENKFIKGMNWENYGKKGWQIDHIKPVSKFNLLNEEELRKCFHYTNTQPLWWLDNLKKFNN